MGDDMSMWNPFKKKFVDETHMGLTIDDPNDVVPDQELPEYEVDEDDDEVS